MKITYKKDDWLWVIGLIFANLTFYFGDSKWYHYYWLNFVAIITMLMVGILKGELKCKQ